MNYIQKSVLTILLLITVWNSYGQKTPNNLINNTFTSKVGFVCEEVYPPDPCAGEQIYMSLTFEESNVTIIEKNIGTCGDVEYIAYELKCPWELVNDKEIKIDVTGEPLTFKYIENMTFTILEDKIIGQKRTWDDRLVDHVFVKDKSKL